MSRVVLPTYPRCPDCGAVVYPRWLIHHRPGCTYEALDPTQWPKEAQP